MNPSFSLQKLLTACCLTLAIGAPGSIAHATPAALQLAQATLSQQGNESDDALKIAALEALMTAPPERAFPLVKKVLEGRHSNEVKARALFVLSQLDTAEAQRLLLATATSAHPELRQEAVRMIGIAGDAEGLAALREIYRSGDEALRDSVLNAYLIAGDPDPVLQIARDAQSDAEFDRAVRTLAAMGETEALQALHYGGRSSEGLMQAFAIAGDLDSLLAIVRTSEDPQERRRAIRNIGITGSDAAGPALVGIYREHTDEAIREAALEGLLVSGYEQGVIELFRASADQSEKKQLLRTLVMMDSDRALELVDGVLEGDAR